MATNSSSNIPTSASGTILQGQGVGVSSNFSTATYPATATGTGKLLRADGTNWTATTATYPDTAGTSGNVLTSDGTNWSSSAPTSGSGLVLISTATASSSATISFTGLTSTYFSYKIIFQNVTPASDQVDFSLRTSANNGSSYDSGATDYNYGRYVILYSTQAVSGNASSGVAQIPLTFSQGNAANETTNGELIIINPSASNYCHMFFNLQYTNYQPAIYAAYEACSRLSAAAVNAIQFSFSSGNIATGIFKLYGIIA